MIEYQAETQRLMVRVAVALIDKTRSKSRNEDSFFDIWFGLASLWVMLPIQWHRVAQLYEP
jgi:hypothetical protein